MQKNILAFGELLWDLFSSGPVLGGAPANFAYRVNCLGNAGTLLSRIGADSLGDAALDQLTRLRMDTRYLQRDAEHPTGTVRVQLDAEGNPDFFIVPNVAYDHIQAADRMIELAARADCVCYGTLVQRAATSRETLRTLLQAVAPQAVKLLDLNLRKDCYSEQTVTESLEQATILKLNEREVDYLASLFQLPARPIPQFAHAVIEKWALSHCLITLGERGSFALSAAGEQAYGPGYRVKVADTCGSGDACTAGFIHALLGGEALAKCVHLGNALGAMVAMQTGATEPITPGQVEHFLQHAPELVPDPGLARAL